MIQPAKLRTVSVSNFKAHCTEELRSVEEEGTQLAITRHGKVIAMVEPPKVSPLKTLGTMRGSAADLVTIPDAADLVKPAWADEDWDMLQDEPE